MTAPETGYWCAGCGVEITWGPVHFGGALYCCEDCAHQRPCACGERMEWTDDRRRGDAASDPATMAAVLPDSR